MPAVSPKTSSKLIFATVCDAPIAGNIGCVLSKDTGRRLRNKSLSRYSQVFLVGSR